MAEAGLTAKNFFLRNRAISAKAIFVSTVSAPSSIRSKVILEGPMKGLIADDFKAGGSYLPSGGSEGGRAMLEHCDKVTRDGAELGHEIQFPSVEVEVNGDAIKSTLVLSTSRYSPTAPEAAIKIPAAALIKAIDEYKLVNPTRFGSLLKLQSLENSTVTSLNPVALKDLPQFYFYNRLVAFVHYV